MGGWTDGWNQHAQILRLSLFSTFTAFILKNTVTFLGFKMDLVSLFVFDHQKFAFFLHKISCTSDPSYLYFSENSDKQVT